MNEPSSSRFAGNAVDFARFTLEVFDKIVVW
jgi:hypothetical protein